MKVKSIEVREKVNRKLELDDSIPDFGDDN
jgi:hypothetical protein